MGLGIRDDVLSVAIPHTTDDDELLDPIESFAPLQQLGSPYFLRPYNLKNECGQLVIHYHRPLGSVLLADLLSTNRLYFNDVSVEFLWKVFYCLLNAVAYLETVNITTVRLVSPASILLLENGMVQVSVPHAIKEFIGLAEIDPMKQLDYVCECLDDALCHNEAVSHQPRLGERLEGDTRTLQMPSSTRAKAQKRSSSVRANLPAHLIHLTDDVTSFSQRAALKPTRSMSVSSPAATPCLMTLTHVLELIKSSSFTAIMTAKTLLNTPNIRQLISPIKAMYSQTLDLSKRFLSPLIEALYDSNNWLDNTIDSLLHFAGRVDQAGRTALMHIAGQPVGCLVSSPCEFSMALPYSGLPSPSTSDIYTHNQHIFRLLIEQEHSYLDNSGSCASCYALASGNLSLFAMLKEKERCMYSRVRINPFFLTVAHAPTNPPDLALLSYADVRLPTGHTALMLAAVYNAIDWIPHLISKANIRLANGTSALMLAAERGHVEIVKVLASHESKYRDANGNTALLRVLGGFVRDSQSSADPCDEGMIEKKRIMLFSVVRILAEHESDIADASNRYPIDYAISLADNELVQLLATYPYPKKSPGKKTRMMEACINSNYPLVCALYRSEAGLSDDSGCTALIHISKSQATQEMLRCIQLLLRTEAGLQDKEGKTALMHACVLGHIEQIKLIYRYESGMLYFDRQTHMELTELQLAEKAGVPPQVIEYLLQNNPVERDNMARTPLMEYVIRNSRNTRPSATKHTYTHENDDKSKEPYCSASSMELHHYIDTQTGMRDKEGRTALMYSAENNQVGLVKLLVGKELYLKTIGGETALMHCSKEPLISRRILELLSSESGMRDNTGKTALIHAVQRGNSRVASALVDKEAGIVDLTGRCALHYSVFNYALNTISTRLIEKEGSIKDSHGHTAFMLACQAGNEKIARMLLKPEYKGANDCYGRTALMYCCHFRMEKLITELEDEAGAVMTPIKNESIASIYDQHNLRPMDSNCVTALHLYLCAHGHNEDIITTLYETEKNISTQDKRAPLYLAIHMQNTVAAEILSRCEIRNGRVYNEKGNTPLMTAVVEKNKAQVEALAPYFCGLKNKRTGKTALLLAIEDGYEEGCAILCEYESRILDKKGVSPLYLAIERKQAAIVSLIIPYGTGLRSPSGQYALHTAMIIGATDIVLQLLSYETNLLESNGITPLMVAASTHREIESLMEYAGQQDSDGRTALIYAVLARNVIAMHALLKMEVKLADKTGQTVLMYAARNDLVEILYNPIHQACIRKQTRRGWTALMWAAVSNHIEAVELLKDAEARMTTVDGETALMLAAKSGQVEAVRALVSIEGGLYIAVPNSLQYGFTALHFAASAGQIECVKALIEQSQEAVLNTPAKRSAAEWARAYKFEECASLIEAASYSQTPETRAGIIEVTLRKGRDSVKPCGYF